MMNTQRLDKILKKMIISNEEPDYQKYRIKNVQCKTLKQIPTVNNSHKHKTI